MKIEVLCHSSIKISLKDIVIYSDPFRIKDESHDANIIIITHSHYDHFSEEDINKVRKDGTKILVTNDLLTKTLNLGFCKEDIIIVEPNNSCKILDIEIDTIPSYNINKKFHLKEKNWVGYLLNIENKMVYIAGDTDITEENRNIKCDVALVPIGGTYTMDYSEAAKLINIIKPQIAIPTHYGEIVGTKEDAEKFINKVDNNIKVILNFFNN